MENFELQEALNLIQDEDTVITGSFQFDREYSAVYACSITGVSLSYNSKANNFDAVIHFKEEKGAANEEDNVIGISKSKSVMTKDKLLAALSLLKDEGTNLAADFTFDDPWSSSRYNSYIFGVELRFEPRGLQVIICTKEAKEEESEVAA